VEPGGEREQRNAMAARGYWLAYQSVQGSVRRVVEGANPGDVAADHRNSYRELFAPSVTAGILKPGDLAGYRNGPVYIRKSMHVPLNSEAVLDTMPALFDVLRTETETSVRAPCLDISCSSTSILIWMATAASAASS
jgi:hypothetical protein